MFGEIGCQAGEKQQRSEMFVIELKSLVVTELPKDAQTIRHRSSIHVLSCLYLCSKCAFWIVSFPVICVTSMDFSSRAGAHAGWRKTLAQPNSMQ